MPVQRRYMVPVPVMVSLWYRPRGEKKVRLKIEYTGGLDFSSPTVLPDRVNTAEYTGAANQAAAYDGIAPVYPADVIATLPDTDWQKLALRNNAIQQRHALSFSGIKTELITIRHWAF